MNRMNNKTLPETILDWFERNPTAKARSGPLAKAIKVDATRVAQALGSLADAGKLVRCKIFVASAERTRGAPEQQWEYALPAGGTALTSVKQLKRETAVRRDQLPGATATPRSKERDPLPTTTPAPVPAPGAIDETEQLANKPANTTPSADARQTAMMAEALEPSQQEANSFSFMNLTGALLFLQTELDNLSPDDYSDWIEAGRLCKSKIGEAGFSVWATWSAKSKKCDANALQSTWNSLAFDSKAAHEDSEDAPDKLATATISALQRQAMTDQDLIQSLKQRVAILEGQAASNDEKAGPPAATGYLVIVPKRKPRKLTKFESAQQAATIAANVAGRADVVALVPVGTARRETVKTSVWHKA